MNQQTSLEAVGTIDKSGFNQASHFASGQSVELEVACIHELFEAQVLRTPDAVAVALDGETLSYRELNERANRLAHHLRRHGVGPDILVGVSMERSFDLIISIYAVLKAGGAYVPLDPNYPLDRLHYMVAASNLHCLVTHSNCRHLYQDLTEVYVVLVDESGSLLAGESERNLQPLAIGDNLIYVIFTSGSTGQPKAAAVYHKGFSNLVQWFVQEFEIGNRDHALLVSSLSFDLTQKNLFATLIAGGSLYMYPHGPYDLSVLTRLIDEHGITLLNCTPSAFYPLIEPWDDVTAASLSSLRVVFLGGEPISIARVKPWIMHPSCIAEVANTYGPTECTDICGFYRLTRENLDQFDFVPLGRPVFNVQMAILDSAMQPCAIGQSGELCVGGAGVGAGYLNDAEMTREKFVVNTLPEVTSSLLYRTGDQARWHHDGVIEFLGRLDYQVKIRGFRIELPEIERAAESHEVVSEAIVIVQSDSQGGDPQLACCFTTHHDRSLAVPELRCHLAGKLPAHMIPSFFEELPTFPLSPNGKVDRKALAERVRDRHQHHLLQLPALPLPASSATSGIGLEDQIHAAWCELLDRAEASFDETFFDLGGDSLQLARLHQMLERIVERQFPITDLFANPTIRTMAQHLGAKANSDGQQQTVRDRAKLQREAQAARRRTRR